VTFRDDVPGSRSAGRVKGLDRGRVVNVPFHCFPFDFEAFASFLLTWKTVQVVYTLCKLAEAWT
jgi:hypothetical protein